MKAIQVIFLNLLCILAANAQVFKPGRCPKPAVQQDFDPARYLGKWYEIQKMPMVFQRGQCCTATYSLQSPGVVGVLNAELLADGTVNTISGTAKPKDPAEPAKLEVTFFEYSPPSPYWVLSTDYGSYALIYSCNDFGLFHVEFSWILSREPTLPEETIEDLHSTLTSFGASVDKMTVTNQDEAYCQRANK